MSAAVTLDQAAGVSLFAAVESVALRTGLFARVNTHQPLNAPGVKLSCSIVLGPVVPDTGSGLAAVSLDVTFMVRVFSPMNARPLDDIDPAVLGAVSVLMGAYSAGFTLGGLVREVDLMRMRAEPAYLLQDGKEFRTMAITLPVIWNDAWTEAP